MTAAKMRWKLELLAHEEGNQVHRPNKTLKQNDVKAFPDCFFLHVSSGTDGFPSNSRINSS